MSASSRTVGLTETLPRLVGIQWAGRLLYTGEQVSGARAAEIGLCDEVAPAPQIRSRALDLARAIGAAAPLAVRSVRATLRRELLAALPAAMDHENAEQIRLSRTSDAREGIRAACERREPLFTGSDEGPDGQPDRRAEDRPTTPRSGD